MRAVRKQTKGLRIGESSGPVWSGWQPLGSTPRGGGPGKPGRAAMGPSPARGAAEPAASLPPQGSAPRGRLLPSCICTCPPAGGGPGGCAQEWHLPCPGLARGSQPTREGEQRALGNGRLGRTERPSRGAGAGGVLQSAAWGAGGGRSSESDLARGEEARHPCPSRRPGSPPLPGHTAGRTMLGSPRPGG